MDKITQEACFRQRVLKYAERHGVTAAANRYRISRKTVHKWKNRYDGTVESLKDQAHTPHRFPRQQSAAELKRVKRRASKKGHPQHKRLYGLGMDERPEEINNREKISHWEIDTVVGTQESDAVLLTLDERSTRYRHIIKIVNPSVQAVADGIRQLRESYGERFQAVFRSITSDNGIEFSSLPLRSFFSLSYLI